jgi:hypothetical protein
MISPLLIRRGAFVACLASSLAPLPSVQFLAAENEVQQRDFSEEATGSNRRDRFERLRDPELRRHYLDQLQSRQRLDLELQWSGNADLEPGAGDQLPQNLPPEIRRLQEAMGGPQVNQFPALRDPSVSRDHQRPTTFGAPALPAAAVRTLRQGAAQLDEIANRLEQLELYPQADAIREQAQRLRLDARAASGPGGPASVPRPTPAQWFDASPATPPIVNSDPPQPAPQPSLEPTPQPDSRYDAPQPQPLLDSPEATPKPDVEVEG